jgi:hypothetical protein
MEADTPAVVAGGVAPDLDTEFCWEEREEWEFVWWLHIICSRFDDIWLKMMFLER